MSETGEDNNAAAPKRTLILDTSVQIHDPESFLGFDEHQVVIPIGNLKELDGLKQGFGEVARHSRMVSRMLDKLTETRTQDILNGITLPHPATGTLRFYLDKETQHLPNDERIVAIAEELKSVEKMLR